MKLRFGTAAFSCSLMNKFRAHILAFRPGLKVVAVAVTSAEHEFVANGLLLVEIEPSEALQAGATFQGFIANKIYTAKNER